MTVEIRLKSSPHKTMYTFLVYILSISLSPLFDIPFLYMYMMCLVYVWKGTFTAPRSQFPQPRRTPRRKTGFILWMVFAPLRCCWWWRITQGPQPQAFFSARITGRC